MERLQRVERMRYSSFKTRRHGIFKIPHTPEYRDLLKYEELDCIVMTESNRYIDRSYIIGDDIIASVRIDMQAKTWILIEE